MNKVLLAKYYQKARLASFMLQFIPFIRLIALTGSLARKDVNKNSDVDLFIITLQNRLWTVRFAAIVILDLFNLRAKNESTRCRICLNRFLSDKNLLLSPQNLFHAQEYSQIVPLFDGNNYYQRFLQNNGWMKKYQIKIIINHKSKILNHKFIEIARILAELLLSGKVGNWLEGKLKKYQVKKIAHNPFFQQKGSRLKISKEEFYYHQDPQ